MRLVISNTIEFPITVKVPGASGAVEHSFRLIGKRYSKDEWRESVEALQASGGQRDVAFLLESITGWTGQSLVVADDGVPVPFSTDALRLLLTIPGMDVSVFVAYQRAQHASLTEGGRLKNSAS